MGRNGYAGRTSPRWSGSFFAVPGTGVLGSLWFPPVAGPGWSAAVLLAAFALAVLLLSVWRSRARADRRWKSALTLYAEREITKARHLEPLPSWRTC